LYTPVIGRPEAYGALDLSLVNHFLVALVLAPHPEDEGETFYWLAILSRATST
jgi:hypothetical protein